jgi:exosortase
VDQTTLTRQCSHDASSISRVAGFLFLLALSVIFAHPAIEATFKLAWSDDAYTYLLLILPLSLGLIYMRRGTLAPDYEPDRAIGAGVMLIALLASGVAEWLPHLAADVRLSTTMLAVVLWSVGSVIFCLGLDTFKSFVFPLCFLILIVPLPHSAVDRMIQFLQYQSAVAAEIMFRAAGANVIRNGLILAIPGLNIEVAPECSSIRTSELLVITAIILSQLFLRSWWSKKLLVVAAIPLSITKNAFRIFTIAMLGTRVDPGFLNGSLHRQGGLLFYGLAVALMVALVVGLRRKELHAESSAKIARSMPVAEMR